MGGISRVLFGGICIAAVLVSEQGLAQKARELNIGLASTTVAGAPVRLAKELGLYEKHGLDAKLLQMENANIGLSALISGSIYVAVGGPGEIITAQARGQKVVAVVNINNSFPGSLVLSKNVVERLGVSPNAPVKERLKALNGLTIGSSSATSILTLVVKGAAEAEGANIRFVYMSQTATPGALQKEAIDGYVASAPVWTGQVMDGSAIMWVSGPRLEFPRQYAPTSATNLQVMRGFAEANPDLIKTLSAVFSDFIQELNTNPAKVKSAMAKLYPDLSPQTLDLLFTPESQAWKTKPLTKEDMAHEISLVKLSGVQLPQLDSLAPASLIYP